MAWLCIKTTTDSTDSTLMLLQVTMAQYTVSDLRQMASLMPLGRRMEPSAYGRQTFPQNMLLTNQVPQMALPTPCNH